MQLASMELPFYGMAAMLARGEWKFASVTLMDLCVMTFGMTLMLKWSAGDLVFQVCSYCVNSYCMDVNDNSFSLVTHIYLQY